MDAACPSCRSLQDDCGGHWNTRRGATPVFDGRRGRPTLDVYDNEPDHDANAYQPGQDADD